MKKLSTVVAAVQLLVVIETFFNLNIYVFKFRLFNSSTVFGFFDHSENKGYVQLFAKNNRFHVLKRWMASSSFKFNAMLLSIFRLSSKEFVL